MSDSLSGGRIPTPGVLGKTEILTHLGEVAEELAARDIVGTLVVVGGSYLALHDLRETTADVDSLTRLDAELRTIVRTIAHRRGLRIDWLNDKAAGFRPGGLQEHDCDILYQHPHLTVLGPPPDHVFLMKLYAGRAPDHDDMVTLWPLCGFRGAQQATDAYYDAYPHEEHDPHLVDYVQQIADQAGA